MLKWLCFGALQLFSVQCTNMEDKILQSKNHSFLDLMFVENALTGLGLAVVCQNWSEPLLRFLLAPVKLLGALVHKVESLLFRFCHCQSHSSYFRNGNFQILKAALAPFPRHPEASPGQRGYLGSLGIFLGCVGSFKLALQPMTSSACALINMRNRISAIESNMPKLGSTR